MDKVKLHRALTRVLISRIPRDCASDLELLRDYIEDSEPVKHGQWIRGENKGFPEKPSMIWYCSVCGGRIRYNDTPRKYQKVKKKVNEVNPRCRRCGARMDENSE